MHRSREMLKMAALCVSALIAFPLSSHADWAAHFTARFSVIEAQVDLLGTGDVMLLGDSNTEMFWWNQNAGCQIVNAGFGGATASDIAGMAVNLAGHAHPKIVHIMIGTNDSLRGIDPAQFETSLRSVVDAFQSVGSKVVLWPIPPFASGVSPVVSRDAINDRIHTVAGDKGAYWDWWWPNQITDATAANGVVASGYAVAGAVLEDGVHLSPSAQTSRLDRLDVWRNYIQQSTGVTCN